MNVTLLKDHIHAGIKYLEGEVIDVEQHIAAWLAEHGIIAAKDAPKSAAAPAKSAAVPKTTPTADSGATKE